MLANQHHPELTPYDRYGNRIDEVTFHPSWHWLMERGIGHGLAAAPWESERAAPARPSCRRLLRVVADRAGPRLPDLDDVRRSAGAASRRRDRQGVDAPAGLAPLRPRRPRPHRQGRRAGRHGHDREAGRLGRPGQRDRGPAHVGGRLLHAARAQVVHQRADERPVPRPRAGRGRRDLLRGAARAGRRDAQPARRGAAQGQARQPLQRVLGAGARRDRRAAPRRRGPRRTHDHRDGGRDPARLRPRLRVADAARAGRGVVARLAPLGLRRPPGRQAAHAERHRRPGRRVGGRDRARAAARRRGRPAGRRARGGAAPDRPAAREVLGLQAHAVHGRGGAGVPGRQRLRRGVGSAAALPRVAR